MEWSVRVSEEDITPEQFEEQSFDEQLVYDNLQAQLYDLIVTKTSGKARTVIKTVPEGNGLLAWKRLHRECGETTVAEYGMVMARLMDPRPIKHSKELSFTVQNWEADVLKLNRESPDHALSGAVMRNVLTEKLCSCVPALREQMRIRNDEYPTFEKAKMYILDYARRNLRNDPNAMDVGAVDGAEGHYEEEQGQADAVNYAQDA